MNESEVREGMKVRTTEPLAGVYCGMEREIVVVPAGTEVEVGCEDDDPPGTWILNATVELRDMLVDVELCAVRPFQFEAAQ